jgi:hypothetical protein
MTVANFPAGGRRRPAAPAKPFWLRLLDGLGSVTFGVSTLVALLVYSWLGSAGLQPFYDWFPRQSVELTEMEWFNWWPFHLICILLALSLILVTIRRIPFNLPNLGVWTVHVGVLVLMLGCLIYFGLKREGDMAVYRRQAVVQLPGGKPVTLTLQPEAEAIVSGGDRVYRVSVADLNSSYELLTGNDKGKKTLSAQLQFQPLSGGGQPFIRQMLVGYPEYTEDVVPGQGRAIKLLGRKLIDDSVTVSLDYAPNDRIFLYDRPALMLRTPGSAEWTEYAVRGLPRYREYVASADAAFVGAGESPLPVRPLSLEPRLKGTAGPGLEQVSARVTGFLPYAMLSESWEAGGNTFAPYVRFTVQVGSSSMSEVLLANDPNQNHVKLGDNLFDARFLWVDDPAVLERLRNPGAPRLRARAGGVEREFPLGEVVGREIALAGTPYTLQGLQFFPEWVPPGTPEGAHGSMVLIRVKGPKGTFLRAVTAPDARLTRDLDAEGRPLASLVDDGIALEAGGIVESGLKIVGSRSGVYALLVSDGGQVMERVVTPGQPVEFLDGAMKLTVWEASPTSHRVAKPRVVPRHERDAKSGTQYSLVQVELAEAGQPPQTEWVEYSHYAHPSRVGFYPRRVTLPSGRQVELLYSRETLKLPAPVALEEFQLEVYPGGEKERDYKSLVRFHENGRWSEIEEVHSNNPTEHDGWWYFQSTWDPPDERAGYAGMNYTGLGVGNRHGVGTMLLGSVLTVLGTLWAFYVKPVILRRRLGERGAGDRGVPQELPDEEIFTVPPAAASGAARVRLTETEA